MLLRNKSVTSSPPPKAITVHIESSWTNLVIKNSDLPAGCVHFYFTPKTAELQPTIKIPASS